MVQNHSLRPVLIGSISSQLHASSKPDLDYILYTIKVYQVIYSSRTIRTNMATENVVRCSRTCHCSWRELQLWLWVRFPGGKRGVGGRLSLPWTALEHGHHQLSVRSQAPFDLPLCSAGLGSTEVVMEVMYRRRSPWRSDDNSAKLSGRGSPNALRNAWTLQLGSRKVRRKQEQPRGSDSTCMPSCPEMPIPTSAAWIMLTSFAPSPERREAVRCLYPWSSCCGTLRRGLYHGSKVSHLYLTESF